MGLNFYRDEPLFRAIVDDCCERLQPYLGRDLRELLFPMSGDEMTAQISLRDTLYTQPAIFVIEYALARFWQSLGVEPAMMVGHSVGEFVAATLAGVWELEDVLSIIALRGRLMQDLPRGSMTAVNSSAESIAKILPAALSLASVNAPNLCVVSGPAESVQDFETRLASENIVCRQLHTSHAFHSAMIEPIIAPLREAISKIKLRAPEKPFVSSVTGRLITAAETTDASYWASHARATVEFAKAIASLKEQGYDFFLECGPRATMCALTRQQFTPERPCVAIPTLSDTHENNAEWETLLFALGSLWQNGVSIHWDAFYAHEDRRRIPVPTYPYERQRFWVDPAPVAAPQQGRPATSSVNARPASEIQAPQLSSPAVLNGAAAESASASRKERIASRVLELLVSVSGRIGSQIDGTATFMEQGFDSLSLTQVAFAIRKEFSAKVSFSQLMNQFPNVDLLAAHLDSTLPAGAIPEIAEVRTGSSYSEPAAAPVAAVQPANTRLEEVVAEQAQTIARLVALLERAESNQQAQRSSADLAETRALLHPQDNARQHASGAFEALSTIPQRGIYASSCFSKNLSASYNESMTAYFAGNISVEKMTRAMEDLVERHDALRASFDESGRIMKIAPEQTIPMELSDLSATQSSVNHRESQKERLAKLISGETDRPFQLPNGPLFRSRMILLAPDRAALVLTAHHAICDGWSLDVLIHDLCAFYSEKISGVAASLEPRQSYLDYVKGVTERDRSGNFIEAELFWHDRFANGLPALVLPADHPRTVRREFRARRIDRSVPPAVVRQLRSVAAQLGCSFFAVLLGSLSILFARVSRQLRFVIALPIAEQPVIGKPGLVGHCVNLAPFPVELRQGESAGDFIKRVQHDLVAVQDHAIFTMVSLLEDLRPVAQNVGISPISAGFTSVKKFKAGELPQSGFTVEYDANPKGFESFEFYLSSVECEDELDFHCHYDVKLFEEPTIQEWLSKLCTVLQDLPADPSRDVLDLAGLNRTNNSSAAEIIYTRSSNREASSEFPGGAPASARESIRDASAQSSMAEPELIEALLPLWRRILHLREIGPDDEFFELGGHSVAAARLFALIQSELGISAPLATLYDASTPRLLARTLCRGSRPEDWRSLVAINRHGNRPPLFLIHAAEGNVLLYRSLAGHLGEDQPVFGLQSAGLDGRTAIDARFEHVARNYIHEVRQIQPHGPYMLGGYCLGGTIAMEMARQLLDLGESVGLVALFEDYNIRAMRWPLPLRQRLVNRFVLNPYFHLQNVVKAEGAGGIDFFKDKLQVEIRRAKVSVRAGLAGLRHRFFAGPAPAMLQARIADIYEEALVKYDVKPYPGELTIFLAKSHQIGFGDRLAGWGVVAQGGVRLFSLPCAPKGSLIEPYVVQLASILRGCIDGVIESKTAAPSEPGNSCDCAEATVAQREA